MTTATPVLFVEWSKIPTHTLTFTEVEKLPEFGFRTVYMYEQEVVETLQTQGNAAGMSRFKAWSDCIFIDIDNDPNAAEAFKIYFRENQITFTRWESGGKGIHFHVPTPLYGHMKLPAIHAKYIKDIGIPCDVSLYRHNSLFRLPGTVHRKTKKTKRLLETFDAKQLSLPDSLFEWAENAKEVNRPSFVRGEEKSLDSLLLQALTLTLNEPQPGTRYMRLWSLARNMADYGFTEDFAGEFLEVINDNWQNPKPKEEIERALSEAFAVSGS